MSFRVWILPNRNQGDDILCFDGKRTFPLRDRRPRGFSHTIPNEVLQRSQGLPLYSYRAAVNSRDQCVFVCAKGPKDVTGRTSFIGILLVGEFISSKDFQLSVDGLAEEDRTAAETLNKRLTDTTDPWVISALSVLDSQTSQTTITNVDLDRATFSHSAGFLLQNGIPVKKNED